MNEENWYPSEEEYTPNLSKDDWLKLLQDEEIFDYNSMCLMRRMKDIGGQATFTQLAEKYGESADHYAGITTPLAKRISENSNCNNPPKGKNGYVKTWSILFLFKDVKNDKAIDGSYICKLRPELSTALDEIDLTKYELYEGKNKMVLQEIYEKQCEYYTDCFPKYEKQVKRFINAIKNNTCDDEVKKDLIYTKDNHIANVGRGTIPNTNDNPNYNNLLARWGELYSILKNIVDENDCTNEQFNQIRQIFKECCGREKTVAPNRIIATFLPNVLTTTANETDFYFVLDKMKSIFDDYPSITKNWLTDNKKFIEYVNQNVKFKHPWHSSIFAWCLKEYFEMIDEQNKDKQKEQQKEMDKIEHYKKLLQANHNLILTGAPGTGKTHTAKDIAKAMGCTDDEIGFVQFHPSYDYTDFVEGLRPKNDDDGNVGFERRDGVFKKFCKNALKANFSDGIDNFDESWENLVEYLNENDCLDVQLLSGKSNFRVELNEYGDGLANRTYENDDFEKGNWVKGKSKFFSKEQLYNIYKGLKGVPKGGHDNYRKAVVAKMKSDFGLKDYKVGTETNKKNPYVFIIDEINRGEISKIFGELFFSIDPGYRGTSGKVQTQYQNLVEEGDDFFDGFFVPENVYIIGTMNDIDRSVESMDFAFRRRFVFKEVSAEESAENMGITNPAMKRINDEIAKPENELGKDYQLGGAYFLDDMTDQERWDLKISRLIKEYLRGIDPNGEKFQAIENAYFGKNQVAEKQDDEHQDEASD